MKILKVIIALSPALLLTGCLEINLSVGSGGSGGKIFEAARSGRTSITQCRVHYNICMKPLGSTCTCPNGST